jgi:hypothetical protein
MQISSNVESRNLRIVMLLPQGLCSLHWQLTIWSSHCCSSPWPYVDNLKEDQEDEEKIDAKPTVIGSCEHEDCDDCPNWTAYPQSHFGNWTIKPVRKCGIAEAVINQDHPSTIYKVDILEDGQFVRPEKREVNSKNKREFWNDVLQIKARVYPILTPDPSITPLSARARNTRPCAICGQNVGSCIADAWLQVSSFLNSTELSSPHAHRTGIISNRFFSALASTGYPADTRYVYSLTSFGRCALTPYRYRKIPFPKKATVGHFKAENEIY